MKTMFTFGDITKGMISNLNNNLGKKGGEKVKENCR